MNASLTFFVLRFISNDTPTSSFKINNWYILSYIFFFSSPKQEKRKISRNIQNDTVSKGICNFKRIVPEEEVKMFLEVENIQGKIIMPKNDTEY